MIVNNVLSKMVSMGRISAIKSTISSALDALNCVKIAFVDEYYPETRTARVRLANKHYMGVTNDGVQKTVEYPPLFVKVLFIGTPNNGIDFKVSKDDEVLVFFSDREIQSWWETGEVCQLDDFRTHNMSDGIAIAGLRSLPNTLPTDDNLNIYSKNGIININGTTVINGDVTINGNLEVTGDVVVGGISFLGHVHGNGNQGADTTAPKG